MSPPKLRASASEGCRGWLEEGRSPGMFCLNLRLGAWYLEPEGANGPLQGREGASTKVGQPLGGCCLFRTSLGEAEEGPQLVPKLQAVSLCLLLHLLVAPPSHCPILQLLLQSMEENTLGFLSPRSLRNRSFPASCSLPARRVQLEGLGEDSPSLLTSGGVQEPGLVLGCCSLSLSARLPLHRSPLASSEPSLGTSGPVCQAQSALPAPSTAALPPPYRLSSHLLTGWGRATFTGQASAGCHAHFPCPTHLKPLPRFCFSPDSPHPSAFAVPRTAVDGVVILLAWSVCHQVAGGLAGGSPLLFLHPSQAPTFLTSSHLTPPLGLHSQPSLTITRGRKAARGLNPLPQPQPISTSINPFFPGLPQLWTLELHLL
ncbi:hypothetical protein Cadr_000031274 [Camelus dromedarius]|uniref:Uncharacterized protein n=1 Tax=Camelus dromedarius TaxID=9838 RepID=A0A5N4BX43_CAMDR|nr:hypothetical protein Cadr_000031274 [Camelus dromedarius]